MKTLVIIGHPELPDSSTQQFLKRAAELPSVTWHPVTAEPLNITAEQRLLRQADRIILQFPLYWYSAPAVLKNWLDQVLTRQFAYPEAAGALVGKELGIAVSLGSPARNFKAGAPEHFSVSQIMTPFQALAHKLKMVFLPTFVIDQFGYQTDAEKAKLLINYQRYLTQGDLDHFEAQADWLTTQFQSLIAQKPSEQKQQLTLILEQLKNNQADLNDLKTNLKMIQNMEDS
ncbi:hypothetical protein GM612_10760 [Lactobacillus sp. CRM56-3]|uniref:Flavodoxin-like fold domain-containing protein n=1 Tax=Secundilactobacillus folii TaxID=2678357 RepID=A0A7X2XWV2_9LACO|nr:hypothetical protein [Secundilactobacillus folii]